MNRCIDIKNMKVAKRYAQALCESAIDNIDEINENLALIDEVIFANPDFMTFFSHPIVSLKDKKETIDEALNGKVNEKALNFMHTLLDESRFDIFKTIYSVFQKEVDEIKNKQRVEVLSVIDLDEEEINKIKEKLNQKINKEIIITPKKDESILGGLVVKLEGKIIDLSLKTKFDDLIKHIKK